MAAALWKPSAVPVLLLKLLLRALKLALLIALTPSVLRTIVLLMTLTLVVAPSKRTAVALSRMVLRNNVTSAPPFALKAVPPDATRLKPDTRTPRTPSAATNGRTTPAGSWMIVFSAPAPISSTPSLK